MSFLRHAEIYHPMWCFVFVVVRGDRNAVAPHLIVWMSFRLAIPWTVALQQSRPPLHQPVSVSERIYTLATICQRTVTTVTFCCLTHGVQSPDSIVTQTRFRPLSFMNTMT